MLICVFLLSVYVNVCVCLCLHVEVRVVFSLVLPLLLWSRVSYRIWTVWPTWLTSHQVPRNLGLLLGLSMDMVVLSFSKSTEDKNLSYIYMTGTLTVKLLPAPNFNCVFISWPSLERLCHLLRIYFCWIYGIEFHVVWVLVFLFPC